MLSSRLTILFFVVLMIAPTAALSAGAVNPYGSQHPAFPALEELVSAAPGGLDALGEAILHRSWITRESVRIKNFVNLDLLHYVDFADVVSGVDGWLFLKKELQPTKCLYRRPVQIAMSNVDLLTEMAKPVGMDVIVSLSPDKSELYPEAAHPLSLQYWDCREHNSALLDVFAARYAPGMIVHKQALLPLKEGRPERRLFFKTDTHWTPYGAAIAYRQLLGAALPGVTPASFPPPKFTGRWLGYPGDLRVGMLMLPGDELCAELDQSVEIGLAALNRERAGVRTLVLRDSFYARLDPALNAMFPGTTVLHVDATDSEAEVARADRVLVNSVARRFVARARSGSLSHAGGLMRGIMARNMAVASASCGEFSQAVPPEQLAARSEERIELALPETESGRALCLRVELSAQAEGELELLMPSRVNAAQVDDSRSVRVPVKARQEQQLTFALPVSASGGAIAVALSSELAGKAVLRSVRVGAMSAVATPSAAPTRADGG